MGVAQAAAAATPNKHEFHFMSKLRETQEALNKARSASPSVLVAFSGGKDSLVVMDLACRTFDHVEGVFRYLVPSLEIDQIALDAATKRWGVKFHQFLTAETVLSLKNGVWCDPIGMDQLPDISSWNIYAAAIKATGIPVILTGMKRTDSQSRRRFLKWNEGHKHIMHPIAGWQKADVVGYLRMQGIPLPESSGGATTGNWMAPRELLWLYDHYPRDYERLRSYFPYVEAQVKRREFYGESACY